jgi:hypothetical protein
MWLLDANIEHEIITNFDLNLGCLHPIACEIKVTGFFRLRNITIVGFYYLFNCYTFRSYDHLQAEIYLLELILLTTDQLFLEY